MGKVLSIVAISRIKPQAERREYPDAACPGLYLIIQPSGTKSWALRHRHGGRPSKLTLGRYADVQEGDPILGGRLTLAAARKVASEAIAAVERGHNPARPRRSRDKNMVEDVVTEFMKRYVNAKKLRSADAIQRTFDVDVLPHWKGRRIDEITRRDVLDLLDYQVDRGAPIQANRTLAAVRRFFNWAIDRDILKTSPADSVKPPTPERSRDRILSDDEIKLFWKACDSKGQPFGPLLKLLLLTGQRLGEVAGMTAGEVDRTQQLWTIPASRAKNDSEHAVALSKQAQEVLKSVKKIEGDSGFIFTTNGETAVSGFGKAKEAIDDSMAGLQRKGAEQIPHWTFHDLRRTAASGMARLGQPVHVVEAVLNHRSGSVSGVAAVYNRYSYGAEKKLALEAWGSAVERLIHPPARANVVPIKARR